MRTSVQLLWVVAAVSAPILAARAQADTASDSLAKDLRGTCRSIGLDRELYGMLLNRNFVALVGSAQSVPGSFGALDIDKDLKAKFAASSQPGKGRVVSVEASGGVEDGLMTLINDKESSSSFSVDVKLHVMLRPDTSGRPRWIRGSMLEYDRASCYAYVAAVARASDSLALRLEDIRGDALAIGQRLELAKLKVRLDSLTDALKKARASEPKVDTLRVDSLRLDSARAEAAKAIVMRRFIPDSADQELDARTKFSADLRAAQELLKVTGFSVAWLSLAVGVENTTFKLFDSAAAFADQLTGESYASPRAVLSYSRFTLSKVSNRSRFWTLGLRASLEDNLGTLKKVELTEKKQYGPTPDDRAATKTISAREGDYKDDLGSLGAFADWYQFFFRDNQTALHLFPKVIWKRENKPTYQAGLGLLWSAKTEKSASVNAELFFNLTDIAEAQPSEENVWERSQLGLRLVFPLNFTSR